MFPRLKKLVLRSEHASLDVDLRYAPVLRHLREHAIEENILEVGSGDLGLAAYVATPVIAVDLAFSSAHLANQRAVVARGKLPFRDRSFEIAVSLDALEHVPRESRQEFVNELIRVARRWVFIGVPEGEFARRHDLAMERYLEGHAGEPLNFLVEHRVHSIPLIGEVEEYIAGAGKAGGRHSRVERTDNVNIVLRELFIRLAWHRSAWMHRLYTALGILSHLDRLFTFGKCYRGIYRLELHDPAK